MVGNVGVDNITALVNEELAAEIQLPFPAVTVYAVPGTAPLITPIELTVMPVATAVAVLNTYVVPAT